MKVLFVGLTLICSAPLFPSQALSQPAARAPQSRIGQIFIVGNEFTKQDVILGAVDLFPGQVLRYSDLRVAQKNLERLGLFRIDPVEGIRPKVTVLDPESDNPYKDILVEIEETSTRSVRVMTGVNRKGEPVVSVVWEERNFDPLRWPTSVADWREGGAFRGAGRLLRLELLQIPLVPSRAPRFFQLGSFLRPAGHFGLSAAPDKTGG